MSGFDLKKNGGVHTGFPTLMKTEIRSNMGYTRTLRQGVKKNGTFKPNCRGDRMALRNLLWGSEMGMGESKVYMP